MSIHICLADLTDKALTLLKAQGLSASTLEGYTKKFELLKNILRATKLFIMTKACYLGLW